MLARLVPELPEGDGFLFEPKWDGFRCIVFKDGKDVELLSRNERSLTRYFPELLPELRAQLPSRCVVDGEIVIATGGVLDFEALLQRIHPAATRIATLARDTPASFIVFDLLALGARSLLDRPLGERRQLLERELSKLRAPLHLTPATEDRTVATLWFRHLEGAGLDGVIAKPLALPYLPGKREMLKIKHQRTADCVVGGFRWYKDGNGVGSLLLGLFDQAGVLHHVGVATGLSAAERASIAKKLTPLRKNAERGHPWLPSAGDEPSAARLPGGPSRWTGTRDTSWEPVRPKLVVEVAYDHLQGQRFRHATRFVRWRTDRTPSSCTYEQLDKASPQTLSDALGWQPPAGGKP